MHHDEVTQLLMLCHFDTCHSMSMIFGHNIGKGLFVNIEHEFGVGNQPRVYSELPKFVLFFFPHGVEYAFSSVAVHKNNVMFNFRGLLVKVLLSCFLNTSA